jgi:hypothetical protein
MFILKDSPFINSAFMLSLFMLLIILLALLTVVVVAMMAASLLLLLLLLLLGFAFSFSICSVTGEIKTSLEKYLDERIE